VGETNWMRSGNEQAMRSECMSEHGRHRVRDEPGEAAPRCECREKGAPDGRRSGPATGTSMVGRHHSPINSRGGVHATRGAEPLQERFTLINFLIIARFIHSQRKKFSNEYATLQEYFNIQIISKRRNFFD